VPGLDLAAGYVPARELGGDFYDFLPYGQGRLGFMLGDGFRQGDGSGAVWFPGDRHRSRNRRRSRMRAGLHARPFESTAARRAARFAIHSHGVSPSTTHPTRKLTLANAGGPYPLLVRNGQVQSIHLEGVPLGLIPDTQYDETTIDLEPGDVVLFASDGILESENTVQEEFGPGTSGGSSFRYFSARFGSRYLRTNPGLQRTATAARALRRTTIAPWSCCG